MALLKLFLFGPPRLERAGAAIDISLHKALGLLAYLAVTKQAYTRDALATMFWPENDASTARANLRRTLYTLNKTIGEPVLGVGAETVSLDPRAELSLDVDVFSAHVRACASTDARELTPECLSRLAQATMLYADDFLAGFALPDSPAFDEWQFFEAERLRRELARVLALLLQAHETRGEYEQAIQYARRWVALDPLHEPAHRRLMQLYAWSRQQAAALRQYQQWVKMLQDELGASPQPETTELYESIRLGRETARSDEEALHPRAMTSRKPAMRRQSIWGHLALIPLGICFAASPMISKLSTTASKVLVSQVLKFQILRVFEDFHSRRFIVTRIMTHCSCSLNCETDTGDSCDLGQAAT